MKLELIMPHVPGGGGKLVPLLGVTTVAALTPPHIEVSLTDENLQKINFDKEVDLIGITAMTSTACRAYEIADTFRKKGKNVVLGGFHPSALPEEAIQHADSVVIGEAEGVWPALLRDFEAGKLKKFYQRKDWANLEKLPIPRRDLLKRKAYRLFNAVETSRGCPFRCNFCSVSSHFGNAYRCRPIEDIIEEVKTLEGEYIFFVDDNIVGIPRRAKELFKALIPYKKKWIGQASTIFARDEELLKLAAQSGCIGMFIGFESLSKASLKEAGKSFNITARYKEDIKKMHAHGISVNGSFIFGFDHDDTSVFERTVKFIEDAKLDTVSLFTLTPFPGTPLSRKLAEENRILTKDWSKYGGVVFKPKLMSPEALREGSVWAWKECYSYRSIFKRVGFPGRHWFLRLLINFEFRKWASTL